VSPQAETVTYPPETIDEDAQPSGLPAPPLALDRRATALFFDFDGTLAPIVTDPSAVRLPPRTVDLLARLSALTSGALAVVSGRPVSELDRLLKPLALPVAGVHGRQRRDAAGVIVDLAADPFAPLPVDVPLTDFAATHTGTLVERKPGAVALHYRRRPDIAADVLGLARGLAEQHRGLRLIEGKMVAEFCLGDFSKGDAVAAFMAEPAFAGRKPAFFGDDVTDEDAYPVVDAAGGYSVRIGPGATRARHRLADVAALQDWLSSLAASWAVPEP
jgi:trehalose 6-phosphate phosphatase